MVAMGRSRPNATTSFVPLLCSALLLGGCSAAEPRAEAQVVPAAAAVINPEVVATVETVPVPHSGDAADDPAVWVDPADPSRSVVIGTDKKGGLAVYDLAGQQLQYLPTGEENNVDVRPAENGMTLQGRPVVLVVAGNRTTNTIDVFELDPGTRSLRDVAAGPIRPDLEVYGSCLYRSASTGRVHAFVNSKDGEVEQWELADDGSGRVAGTRVRSFGVGSQTEGCVADDELGDLYLGEEERGIWQFGAEPDAGTTGTLVVEVSPSGPLVSNVEGLALTYGNGGTGYLIASSQGNDSYAVYRREGEHAYVGSFRISDGSPGGIDGAEKTDGIDVTTAALGPSFPAGLFVAQDGVNEGGQNYKLVPLQDVLPG